MPFPATTAASQLISSIRRAARVLRPIAMLGGLAALSACAGNQQRVDNRIEAQHYAAIATGHYTPPGSAEDPWGPYVTEAAARYDVPESWVRSVMHQESGGRQFMADGTMTTSPVGAMGLMQVMPETYDELRGRYNLGPDAYDPHNNILAGTAYLRELYDLYGMPGFLAAYNCGPGRLDKYLAGTATLPDQTRHYVANIGPHVMYDFPVNRSPADQIALNQLPIDIAPGLRYGPRYGQSYGIASASRRHGHGEVQYAAASRSARPGRTTAAETRYAALETHGRSGHGRDLYSADQPRVQLALATPRSAHGFRLISSAEAAEVVPLRHGGAANWAVQVGAYGSQGQASAAASSARVEGGRMAVGTVRQGRATLYRARVTGLSRDSAMAACQKHRGGSCIVLSPGSQS